MRLINRKSLIISLFFLVIFSGSLSSLVYAGQLNFDLGIGVESLKYEEHLPADAFTLATESEARAINTVAKALLEYDFNNNFFVGVKGVIPVAKGDDTEEWKWEDFGITYQTNKLEYGWSRCDTYIGYAFKLPEENIILADTLEPYIGVRSSWAKQKRSHVVVLGMPQAGTVTEKIDSYGTILGFRAKKNLLEDAEWGHRLSLGFNFEWVFPFDVETTNTAGPGLTIEDKKGYTWKIGASCEYKFTDNCFINLEGYGGKMHWKGSDWIPYKTTSVKWPENDTTYFGGNLSLTFKF